MSGFKDDVIAILKANNMFHAEAIGWVRRDRSKVPKTFELLEELAARKFPVVEKAEKFVTYYSYIVLENSYKDLADLLDALSKLAINGIIIIEDWDGDLPFRDSYYVPFAQFTATKVKFDKRTYMVIHSGVDYGH